MSTYDADRIRQSIAARTFAQLDTLEVFPEIGSTNSYLLDQDSPRPGRFRIAIADHQTAGRGRMDKRWISPSSTGLCMSMAYTFEQMPDRLPALTLAIGTAIVEALEKLQVTGVRLKWPNDIMASDRKLGGILTEMRSRDGDGITVVAGFGMNVDFSAHDTPLEETLSRQVIDLRTLAGHVPDRSMLAAALIDCLFDCMSRYASDGFDPFRSRWRTHDWLEGQRVQVECPDGPLQGTAAGIDADGAFVLQTRDGRQRVMSGSVSAISSTDPSS